ncbi:DUF3192 domain-containing protein [Halioxenophilus aromaticivorans]|uniref:DUF3192 domain-containing protein n=1 Tax=Halioxenophilus aromaticivorans TaxID=1306992 RepID=A0AAV3U249_9ALTE
MLLKTPLVAITAAVLLQGCIIVDGDHSWHDDSGWKKQQARNVENIGLLELNSSRAQVMDIMGRPDFTEAFTRGDKDFYVLYYRTHRHKSDGETSKSETTPLVFEDGRLIGWGDEAMQSAIVY